jgi:hypothetical protein
MTAAGGGTGVVGSVLVPLASTALELSGATGVDRAAKAAAASGSTKDKLVVAGLIGLAAIPGGSEERVAAGKIGKLVEEAKALYPGKAAAEELHHIFPKYLGGAADGATKAINGAYHQLITNEFRRLWPYGRGAPTLEKATQIMKEVYNKLPLPK